MPAHRILPSLLCCIAALPASASASASLSGQLVDEGGKSIPGVRVVLVNRISGYRQSVEADREGRFAFRNVPFNSYHLEAFGAGYREIHRDLELRGSLPMEIRISMASEGAQVQVEECLSLVESHPAAHFDIDRSSIKALPSPIQSRAMENILLATPGFVANDNGRFHFQGSHGQLTYVLDGVPLSDHTHASFSNSLDPAQMESMEILTGGISAEYGGKPVAVVAMTTRSGLGMKGFEGDFSLGLARFQAREAGFTARGGADRFGYFLTGALSETERFLDPPVFENLHNEGGTGRIFSRFDFLPSDRDSLRITLMGGRTRRDVVNLPSQQQIGQDQRMGAQDFNASLGWTRLLGPQQSLECTGFHRHATSQMDPTSAYAPGGPDAPVWAHQQRSLDNWGASLAFTQRFPGGSSFKAGLQGISFPLEERFQFAFTRDGLVDPDTGLHAYTPSGGGNIWDFHEKLNPSLASAYAQTDLHLGPLFLALGLRHDRWKQGDWECSETQPRLGASYRFESTRTILRASYDRLLITPDRENLALSCSHEAAELGEEQGQPGHDHGIHQVQPELQDAWSLGLEQQMGQWGRISIHTWRRRSRNTADVEQFLNTGVEFPIAFAHGFFHGTDLRLDLLPAEHWSAFLSLGHTRALVEGPMVGGLDLEIGHHGHEEGAGRMPIDHDQKFTAQWGLRWDDGQSHAYVGGRYDSGLVAGDPEGALGSADLEFGLSFLRFDASDGIWRVKPRTIWNGGAGHSIQLGGGKSLSISADLMNLTNRKALYNFLSHRGGTHVFPPRTWALRLKYTF